MLPSMKKVVTPQVQEAIKIDKDLHVKLQFCSNSVPLPQWLVKGRTAHA